MNRYILMVIMLVAPLCAMAQKERADIRQGNKLYEQGKFKESQASYAKALKINPTSPEASFNIAGALYKQGLWKEASQAYTALAKEGSAETLYNLGNSLVKERQLDAAIENYKSALRINPSDKEAKFNLAYAQKLKQEGQNKDKNKD
ncbi:MAG: tetratricopeptide repeat protein, partial [Mucinivorans sp.]